MFYSIRSLNVACPYTYFSPIILKMKKGENRCGITLTINSTERCRVISKKTFKAQENTLN